ncbi:MAG: NAD(P)-binding domain-containing protein, partial [Chloroflexi bacterium]|nr:NAD(P)-binding domain-containing protein [Chloroflexota bacterium]
MRQGVAVIGTGMWGTTLAIHLARKGLATALWARSKEEAVSLNHQGENKTLLPDIPFPSSLQITASLETIIPSARLVILAVPAQSMRVNIARVVPYLRRGTILLSA